VINARIVEFNNGQFGVAETYKLFGLFSRCTGHFYSLSGDTTWSVGEYVEKYCVGTFEDAVETYLLIAKKEHTAVLKNHKLQIKRML
jgi:hypothetical protein